MAVLTGMTVAVLTMLVMMLMVVVMVVIVILVMMLMVMMVIMMIFMFIFVMMLKNVNPCGRGGNCFKIKHSGSYYSVKIDVAEVAAHNLCLWLYCLDNLFDMFKFFGRYE